MFDTSDISLVEYSSTSYAVDAVLSLLVALNETDSPANAGYSDILSAYTSIRFIGATVSQPHPPSPTHPKLL